MNIITSLFLIMGIYREGAQATDQALAGTFTVVVVYVRPWISLHVRDRHLRGLLAVAKQQPSPLFTFLFHFLTLMSSSQGRGVKEVGSLL